MQKIPAVSVIIPLYNAEKYIGECLDSILAQTFADFEVVVVDDCSTDSSAAIVESYTSKFDGRLNLVKTRKNHGNPGVPRNIGLNFSCGEYVYFMDNDDLITSTALEEMHALATKFDADVVYMHKCFTRFKGDDGREATKFTNFLRNDNLTAPIFLSEDVAERMKLFFSGNLRVMPWLKFLRRNFLTAEEIAFPQIKVSEDDFWTMEVLCAAKKILSAPNVVYVNRDNPNSLTRKKKSAAELIKYHMTPLIDGEEFFCAVADKYEFFEQNPHFGYAWIEHVANYCFKTIFPACTALKPQEVYSIFDRQFPRRDEKSRYLNAYLFSLANTLQKQLFLTQQQNFQLNQIVKQTQSRIAELEDEIRRLKREE
ncbi:MAG: glycosyltransferase [Selenomonadaceae bacterium]|nr:glycosyltransferase [Selenomonadaceae bacterium]